MGVLPRVLDHGRVLMLFNLTLSDLLALDKVNVGGEKKTDEEGKEPKVIVNSFKIRLSKLADLHKKLL